jgi:hypothetical protein
MTVDKMLRGVPPRPEIRERSADGPIEVVQLPDEETPVAPPALRYEKEAQEPFRQLPQTVKIFPYGVSRSRLDKAIRELKVPAHITKTWNDADAIIALKAHYRREPGRLKEAINDNKPSFVVKSNTQVQIEAVLKEMFGLTSAQDEQTALREAEEAIEHVMGSGEPLELMPQNAYIRRLQHQLISEHHLTSSSVGTEPRRRVRIMMP